MSAQQNQLKEITEADFLAFMNSYNYVPVSPLSEYKTIIVYIVCHMCINNYNACIYLPDTFIYLVR